jgi:hypothetical protein
MNWGIHGSAFAASLFLAGISFGQVAAPGAGPAPAVQPAPAADAPAAKAEPTPQQQKIAGLIQQLAADDFAKRDAASEELQKLGAEALPALREAAKSEDPSIRSYADYLVPKIEGRREVRGQRRLNAYQANAAQQWGIAGNRGMPADVLVARAGRLNINVTATNGVRNTNVTDGDRQVNIQEGPDGIRMSVTENDNGKQVQKDYEAKSIEEMRKEQPEAAAIYDRYNARGRGLAINGNARILRIAPNIAENGLDLDVRQQIQEAQKLGDRALQQQQLRLRDFQDAQKLDVQDQQFELMHKRLQAETEMLEQRLADVEAMRARLLEQTKAAQKRLAELEKQQGQQEKQQRPR